MPRMITLVPVTAADLLVTTVVPSVDGFTVTTRYRIMDDAGRLYRQGELTATIADMQTTMSSLMDTQLQGINALEELL